MRIDHRTHMRAALAEAEIALSEGEFPVGCVMTINNEVISSGRRKNSYGRAANEFDHAEIQTLRKLHDIDPEINRAEITVYSTMEPCLMCYTTLLLNGFRKMVFAVEDVMGGGTSLDFSSLNPLYKDMEVELIRDVCRKESLALFKAFFTNVNNAYWRESLLAKTILEQS